MKSHLNDYKPDQAVTNDERINMCGLCTVSFIPDHTRSCRYLTNRLHFSMLTDNALNYAELRTLKRVTKP